MEHIVTIAIAVDDEDIRERIEETVTEQVTRQVVDKLVSFMLDKYGNPNTLSQKLISIAIGQCKSQIIEEAVKDVTLSIKRSPRYRKALERIETIASNLEDYALELDKYEFVEEDPAGDSPFAGQEDS